MKYYYFLPSLLVLCSYVSCHVYVYRVQTIKYRGIELPNFDLEFELTKLTNEGKLYATVLNITEGAYIARSRVKHVQITSFAENFLPSKTEKFYEVRITYASGEI
jgi:hypothetical protein